MKVLARMREVVVYIHLIRSAPADEVTEFCEASK